MAFFEAAWDVMTELSPWLLLGALVSGLLHGVLPPGFVRRQLSGRRGVVKAVLLGVPMPLCSCGVIPAGIGLHKDGASRGSAVGFVTATPQTGVDSIFVSASFLGWPFAVLKVAAAVVTGIASGWLTDLVAPGSNAPDATCAPEAERPGWRAMVAHGVDVVRFIWGWLVFGVVVSAALTTWLPADAFAGLATQSTLLAFFLVLVASVPLYVCATASVPIAAALVESGMPTGAAMVFLMAGPATNVATMGAVNQAFGRRALGVYLSTLVVGSVAFGLLYEAWFGALVTGAVHAHEHAAPWWATASAVVLACMLAGFALQDARGAWSAWQVSRSSATVEVGVDGMSCNGCVNRLTRTLLAADGVDAATVMLDEKRAVVVGSLSLDEVIAIVRDAGFEPHAVGDPGASAP